MSGRKIIEGLREAIAHARDRDSVAKAPQDHPLVGGSTRCRRCGAIRKLDGMVVND